MPIEDALEITFTPVLPDDPEVSRVDVTGPSNANVGEVVALQATVYDQYGEPMPNRGVEWLAVPPARVEIVSQSPSSMTLKGTEPGSATITGRVIETDPGPSLWPPEGYVELLPDVTFENGQWPAGWEIRESAQGGKATLSLVDGNPLTGGKMARHTYMPGNSDGGGAGYMISPRFTPSGEIIVEEVMRASSNFQGHASGVNKNGYTINDVGQSPNQSRHPHIWLTQASGEGRMRPGFIPQGAPSVSARYISDFEMQRGEWYVLRWRIIFSPDEAIGRLTIWAAPLGEEPVIVGDWNARTSTEDWDQFFDRIQIRPIWGGRGDSVVNEMFKEWARVRICGR